MAMCSVNDNIEVTRDKRRLFGYRDVIETSGEGRHIINCSNPGHTKCKSVLGLIDLGNGTTLSEGEFDLIDEKVEDLITSSNGSAGRFVFNSKCLIVYRYITSTEKVNYTIYSMDEAKQLGLI